MKKQGIGTRAIHAAQPPDPQTGAVMVPVYASSTFAQQAPGVHKGYEYSRSGNPTRAALEGCLADLESGAAGFAFSSGLAAEAAVLDLLPKDSHILATGDLYGGTYRLFEQVKKHASGLSVTYINAAEDISSNLQANTRMVWLETPSNPLLKVYDLDAFAAAAADAGIISVCDNTFATPVLQRPLEQGFDIVVHSLTKYMNGHSDVIGGAAIVREQGELAERVAFTQNATGAVLAPFDAFLVLRGIKTLPLRMQRHGENALAVARFLEKHEKIEQVLYPGLPSHPYYDLAEQQMLHGGGMVSFYIKGGRPAAELMLAACRIFTLAESLGGVESLIEHPGIMTHASIPEAERSKNGISDSLIRLSVGIEDINDLIADLDQALSSVSA